MPYRYEENGKTYFIKRTTEIASSYECEMYAFLENKFRKEVKKAHINKSTEGLSQHLRFNVAALRGTIFHYKVENYLREIIGQHKSSLKLDTAQQKLFKKLMRNKERYKYFVEEIDNAFENFMQFYVDYKNKFIPLYLERKVVVIKRKENGEIDENNSVAGTIDCIAKWKTARGWRTVIVDWKSSKRPLMSHSIQLSGYYWMLTNHQFYQELAEIGLFNEAPYYHKEGKPQVICVIFGGKRYEIKRYNVDIGRWLKAWKIHNNPR
ncbi:MAG: PD-(D/E)XK nuclease family protein, partial [Candidatus Heimdallarchaeaceae archaeon]